MAFSAEAIRREFPIFRHEKLIFLDNASTTQKPQTVIDAMSEFYATSNANVHRAMYDLGSRATVLYESARKTVQEFIHAPSPGEIIFTKNCTEAINLVAKTWGPKNLHGKQDIVALSILEHHSNMLPWMQLRQEGRCSLAWMDIDHEGSIDVDDVRRALALGSVKFLTITGQGNVLGVRPPLKEIISLAHAAGALVLVDAAQLAGHHRIDVQDLDADFLAFSGHKMYGPFGVGVLFGKRSLLREMPPFLTGGMMVNDVSTAGFDPMEIPNKFEAGTMPIASAIGLKSAIDWLQQFSWEDREAHEKYLFERAIDILEATEGVHVLGPRKYEQASTCVSFTVEGVHPHDLAEVFGVEKICIRAGNHCTRPLHARLKVGATARLSVGIYNSEEDLLALPEAIRKAQSLLVAA